VDAALDGEIFLYEWLPSSPYHMTDPVNQALLRIVEQSSTPNEMTRRVIQSFGENKVAYARQIAAETKGSEWLHQGMNDHPIGAGSEFDSDGFILLRSLSSRPSLLVLPIGAMALWLVLLFPPFMVFLPQGMINNAGFGFIFSPPTQGNLTAVVNAPLLALLALGVAVSTVAVYVVLLRIESGAPTILKP
jgi:hypothetical protein